MRIDAHQLAVVIGVAVAGSRRARLDVTHHGTGIAADLVTCCSSRISQHEQALEAGVKLFEHCKVSCDASRRQRTTWTNRASSAKALFVRIRTMLRARPKPVKRPMRRKPFLPNNTVVERPLLFTNKAAGLATERPGLHVCMQTVSLRSI